MYGRATRRPPGSFRFSVAGAAASVGIAAAGTVAAAVVAGSLTAAAGMAAAAMTAAAVGGDTANRIAAAGIAAGIGNKIREINSIGSEITAGIAAGVTGMRVVAGH